MVFDATAHADRATAGHTPFEFQWSGQVYQVPSASDLPTGALRQMIAASATSDASAASRLLDGLEHAWPADAVAALMEMPITTATAVAEAWMAGAAPEGESGKSPSPSPQTTGSGQR